MYLRWNGMNKMFIPHFPPYIHGHALHTHARARARSRARTRTHAHTHTHTHTHRQSCKDTHTHTHRLRGKGKHTPSWQDELNPSVEIWRHVNSYGINKMFIRHFPPYIHGHALSCGDRVPHVRLHRLPGYAYRAVPVGSNHISWERARQKEWEGEKINFGPLRFLPNWTGSVCEGKELLLLVIILKSDLPYIISSHVTEENRFVNCVQCFTAKNEIK